MDLHLKHPTTGQISGCYSPCSKSLVGIPSCHVNRVLVPEIHIGTVGNIGTQQRIGMILENPENE